MARVSRLQEYYTVKIGAAMLTIITQAPNNSFPLHPSICVDCACPIYLPSYRSNPAESSTFDFPRDRVNIVIFFERVLYSVGSFIAASMSHLFLNFVPTKNSPIPLWHQMARFAAAHARSHRRTYCGETSR